MAVDSRKFACQHCGRKTALRSRLLCQPCNAVKGIRDSYPTRAEAKKGLAETSAFRVPPLPQETTTARPGSAEKIEIMVARFERGEQIFHPGDSRLTTEHLNGRFLWPEKPAQPSEPGDDGDNDTEGE